MSKTFHKVSCDSLDDFVKRIRSVLNVEDKWVFRGQKQSEWCLKTTLERACERSGVGGDGRVKTEASMIREFKRRLHQYTANPPPEDALDEWMALMQHHGAPTRLLDFTYSPYVAAYFALEVADPSCTVAVWAVNTDWCEREFEHRCGDLTDHYRSYQEEWKRGAFKAIITDDPSRRFILSVTPRRLNERLAYQLGTFLCPRDVGVGFTDNLSEFAGEDDLDNKVIKFTLPTGDDGETKDAALRQLDNMMNINRITLFPGLDGFAQSFQARVRFFLEQRWPVVT